MNDVGLGVAGGLDKRQPRTGEKGATAASYLLVRMQGIDDERI